MKNELNTCFQQIFAMGSYNIGIGRAWCSRKACEICSSLVKKKKLKKKYFSSHKLPKQQSTSFWSQGMLGVNYILAKVLHSRTFKKTLKITINIGIVGNVPKLLIIKNLLYSMIINASSFLFKN
jgi:hypothetical protein